MFAKANDRFPPKANPIGWGILPHFCAYAPVSVYIEWVGLLGTNGVYIPAPLDLVTVYGGQLVQTTLQNGIPCRTFAAQGNSMTICINGIHWYKGSKVIVCGGRISAPSKNERSGYAEMARGGASPRELLGLI